MKIRALLVVVLLVAGCGAQPAAVPVGVPSVTVMPSGVTFAPSVPESATRPCNPRESLRPVGGAGRVLGEVHSGRETACPAIQGGVTHDGATA